MAIIRQWVTNHSIICRPTLARSRLNSVGGLDLRPFPHALPHWLQPSHVPYHIGCHSRTCPTTLAATLARFLPHWLPFSHVPYHIGCNPRTCPTTLAATLARALPHWRLWHAWKRRRGRYRGEGGGGGVLGFLRQPRHTSVGRPSGSWTRS
jgi:hypothetical protein